MSVKDEKPKDKQECFVAFKGPLGFIYDHGRFYDELNSGLDEDTFEDGTSGFVLDGDVGYALESIDISEFDFSSAENMRDMFNSCWNLKGVKLPVNAKTDKVKDFRFMFYDCFALEELDLSGFNTRSAETMSNMFGYCQKLRKLDISSFDTRKTDRDYGVQYMLYEMNKLEELKVGPYFENWNNVYLAQGRWKNGSLTKTTDELVRGYPGNAAAWAGTWVRDFDLIENLVLNGYEPLMPGETGRVYFYTEPYENVKTDLVWSSSDESVATVDENGIVSAKRNSHYG